MFESWQVVYLYSESLLSQLFKTGLILDICHIVYQLYDVNGFPTQKYPKNTFLLGHIGQNRTFSKNKQKTRVWDIMSIFPWLSCLGLSTWSGARRILKEFFGKLESFSKLW